MSPMIRSIDNTRKGSISIEFAEKFVGLKLLKICYNLKQYTIYKTLLNNLYIYIYILPCFCRDSDEFVFDIV